MKDLLKLIIMYLWLPLLVIVGITISCLTVAHFGIPAYAGILIVPITILCIMLSVGGHDFAVQYFRERRVRGTTI